MKKQLLFLVMMMLPLVASAYEFSVKNADGITIYYNYYNDGTELEVTYHMKGSWEDYQGDIVIPENVTYMNRTRKVTSIGAYAFWACSRLTSVTIPKSVTNIDERAFDQCTKLTSITIPNGVTTIGRYAFARCSKLTSITIPDNVTIIDQGAFSECSGLTYLTIGKSVTSIGWNSFNGGNISIVVSYIENPGAITGKASNGRTFTQNTFNNATLYVPKGSKEKYKSTEGWKDFLFIEEGNPTGIKTIENTQIKNNTFYDLNGVRLSEPKKGINIINGKKLVIK